MAKHASQLIPRHGKYHATGMYVNICETSVKSSNVLGFIQNGGKVAEAQLADTNRMCPRLSDQDSDPSIYTCQSIVTNAVEN